MSYIRNIIHTKYLSKSIKSYSLKIVKCKFIEAIFYIIAVINKKKLLKKKKRKKSAMTFLFDIFLFYLIFFYFI